MTTDDLAAFEKWMENRVRPLHDRDFKHVQLGAEWGIARGLTRAAEIARASGFDEVGEVIAAEIDLAALKTGVTQTVHIKGGTIPEVVEQINSQLRPKN